MQQRLTTEEFITKSENVHGKTFDYSKTKYINKTAKVEIICKKHGSFWIEARKHIAGRCSGCRLCSIEHKTKSQDEFILQCRIKHQNKYDYSRTKYVNASSKVEIICPTHGSFWVRADDHVSSGNGCKLCAIEYQTKSQDEFISQANLIHNHIYDYNRTKYINHSTKVEIICKKHGPFWITPASHLSGCKCKLCANEITAFKQTKPEKKFIEQCLVKHQNKYSYLNVKYIKARAKILVTCQYHGDFEIIASEHLQGAGCSKCSHKITAFKLVKPEKEFIKQCEIIHQNKYSYLNVRYKNVRTKILVTCQYHGDFEISPSSHLRGHGCSKCKHFISKPELKWLDSLSIPNDSIHRNVTLRVNGKTFRADGFDPQTRTVYEFNGDFWHGNPSRFAPDQINLATKTTFGSMYQKTLNKQIMLEQSGYKVISIWESDFNKQEKNVKINKRK